MAFVCVRPLRRRYGCQNEQLGDLRSGDWLGTNRKTNRLGRMLYLFQFTRRDAVADPALTWHCQRSVAESDSTETLRAAAGL
jgi:hypothetical protein